MAPPESEGVAALDRLSEGLLTAVGDLDVRAAGDAAERDTLFRLRHRQVVDGGWRTADELPGDLERDEYDDDAVHIGAWEGHTLAGTVRLVLPRPGVRLPVEAAFDLDIEPRGAVVEVGRLVIAPAYRGDPAHRIWGALYARAWLAMRPLGHTVLAGAVPPALVERMRAAGLPFETLGPARLHWGQLRCPARLDAARGRPGWYAATPARAQRGR